MKLSLEVRRFLIAIPLACCAAGYAGAQDGGKPAEKKAPPAQPASRPAKAPESRSTADLLAEENEKHAKFIERIDARTKDFGDKLDDAMKQKIEAARAREIERHQKALDRIAGKADGEKAPKTGESPASRPTPHERGTKKPAKSGG
jgi:hypothetical protein